MEISLTFDSKYLSYGLVDNNDPILTPAASIMFFDWLSVGVESIYDISHYGVDAGYGNRAWRYQELDSSVTLAHAFGPDDVAWLPTTIALELGYVYEAHPRTWDVDTQFLAFALGLPDLWIEPTFAYECDLERDYGTYLNLELGHTFTLVGPREGDEVDVLDFRLSLAQGLGDARRIGAYLFGVDQSGLMDTTVMGRFTWVIAKGVTLGAYVAYSDYLFNPPAREAVERYEVTGGWKHSWNFTAGVSFAVAF